MVPGSAAGAFKRRGPVAYIGSVVGAATVTIPAGHKKRDLLVAMAVNIDGSGAPAPPGTDPVWTNVATASRTGFGAKNARTYWRVADGNAEVTGTWANTDNLIIHVYRNAIGVGAGRFDANGNSGAQLPALAFQQTNGSSWLMAAAFYANSSADISAFGLITERTQRSSGSTRYESFDKGPMTDWGGIAGNLGTISNADWLSLQVEILKG